MKSFAIVLLLASVVTVAADTGTVYGQATAATNNIAPADYIGVQGGEPQ